MALSKEEREALAGAVLTGELTIDGARDLKRAGSEGERYGWETVKRAKTWAEGLSLEEARVLKDKRLRSGTSRGTPSV